MHPMHPMHLTRSLAALAAVMTVTAGAGCGVAITGNFDGVPFNPDATIMVVADRHDLLERGDAIIAVKRAREAQLFHILLTAAPLEPGDDWRRLPVDQLLEIKRSLSTSDGLLLQNVPLDRLEDGDTVRAVIDGGAQTLDSDFDVAVAPALPEDALVATQGLGARVTVTIVPQGINAQPRGGSVSLDVEVKRERDAPQAGDVATGTVNMKFGASLLPERLTESNLTVAAPILRCMMEAGPSRAGTCRNEDADPYVDETGVVEP